MKNIILIIALIAIVGCKEETPTEQKVNLDKKYTLEELENDPDWIEITDIDTLENICVKIEYRLGGKLLKSSQEYTELYNKTKVNVNCPSNSDSLNVNFNEKDVILSAFSNTPSEWTRKIFKNELLSEIRYVLEIIRLNNDKKLTIWNESISIPKIPSNYKFRIDTLQFWKN